MLAADRNIRFSAFKVLNNFDALQMLLRQILLQSCFNVNECELLRSPMISYQSLLYRTTVLYDTAIFQF